MYESLLAYIRATFPSKAYSQGRISGAMQRSEARFYANGLKKLSDHFNGLHPLAATTYLNLKPYRSAYLLYFFPANWVKMQRILAELAHSPAKLTPLTYYRILDVGSGAGALSFGAVDYLMNGAQGGATPRFELDLIDHSPAALRDAQAFAHKFWHNGNRWLTLKTHTMPFLSPKAFLSLQKRYDLILMGDFLNEIHETEQRAVVERLLASSLSPQGVMILVEPALQKTSRALQRLRDAILKNNPSFQVLAPCLRQGRCPLNVFNNRDWCHFYADWQRPEWMELLEKEAGLRKERLKYSYLVIGREENTRKSPQPPFDKGGRGGILWRVISNPMRSKGKQEIVLCGSQGRIHMTGQIKHKSLKNKDFFDLQRGDKVILDPQIGSQLRHESWDHRLIVGPHIRIDRR